MDYYGWPFVGTKKVFFERLSFRQPTSSRKKLMKRPLSTLLCLLSVAGLTFATGCQEVTSNASGPDKTAATKKTEPSEKAAKVSLGHADYSGSLTEEEKAEVVAKVDGQDITQADLYAEIGPAMFKHRTDAANKEYSIKRGGLDEMIEKILLEKEAGKRGITTEALLKQEVDDKVKQPTEGDLKDFFEENKRRFPPSMTFESAKSRLGQVWVSRETAQTRQAFIDGLREKAHVETMLPFPDLPVAAVDADDDPVKGNKDAVVQIIEFSDFQCPYCKRNVDIMKQIQEEYGDKVAIVFRDFPLSFHDKAQKAAEASECAHEQNKYWEYHDYLFDNQQALAVDDLKKAAEKLGLDTKKFNECLDTDRYKEEIEKDVEAGQLVGVNGTPAAFINGKLVNGAQPFETYKSIIDSELAKSNASNGG